MKSINRIDDLMGKKFGRLTVIGMAPKTGRKTFWICQCDCGNIKTVRSDSLKAGLIRSCGCLKREQDRVNLEANHSHKMSGTRIYQEWQGMKGRCYNEHDPRFDRWGGRGIKVCDEWKDSFENFYSWALANGYNETLTIDRIDNDGDYAPSNCRWASQKEQSRNRSSNINIKIGNSTRTLTEWCEIFDVDYNTVNARYVRYGYRTIDDLFNG